MTAYWNIAKHKKIPIRVQAADLKEDYSYMVAAHSLVSSSGTFAGPAVAMSEKLKVNYVFNFDYCKPGTYFRSGEWKNTAEQLQLMLDFSESDLVLPEDLYAVSRVSGN